MQVKPRIRKWSSAWWTCIGYWPGDIYWPPGKPCDGWGFTPADAYAQWYKQWESIYGTSPR